MATSGSVNWVMTRNEIVTMAYQHMGIIGDGEVPSTEQYTKGSMFLNAIVKELEGEGMPLWKITTFSFTPTASTGSYTVGSGGAINRAAGPPLKIHQAWYRTTATGQDTPINLVTKSDYNRLPAKTQEGVPNQIWYDPPGNQGAAQPLGTIYVWPEPSAAFVAANTIYLVGQFMFEDFDASSDNPDFPSNWNHALSWILAESMCLGEGVPSGKVAQIEKKAFKFKQQALNNGPEEGSVFLQPSFYAYR